MVGNKLFNILILMLLIEPCCTSKTIPSLIDRLGNDGTELWHGYADLTLADILTPILASYEEVVDVTIVIPYLPPYLADALRIHLVQGSICNLTLLTDARGSKGQPAMSLARAYSDSVILASHSVADTFILLPDIVWWGNLGRGEHVGMVSRSRMLIDNMKSIWYNVVDKYRIS